MSVTSSHRPGPGTPFDFNPMYAPRSQSRSHHTQPPQLYTIPGTPAVENPAHLAKTPGGSYPRKTPSARDVPSVSSPSSGYFGLDRDPDESYSTNNWSASSSLRSVAARSPVMLDMEALPTPSENFRRQSSAMAAHNKNHAAHARARSRSDNTAYEEYQAALKSPKADRYESSSSSSSSRKVLSPRRDDEAQRISSTTRDSAYDEQPNYFEGARHASPTPYEPYPSHGRSQSASGWSAASMPHLSGPVAGGLVMRPKEERQRSSTLPPSSQVDGLSLMYASKLAQILDTAPKSILLLDLRPFQAYSEGRIETAINLAIPTTLLKRPSFNVAKLTESLGGPAMKAQLARWKEVDSIIVYDASSRNVKESATAAHTVSKFSKEGWHGEAYLLSGGFDEFAECFPDMVDTKSPAPPDSKAPKSLSLGGKAAESGIPAFNCAMPKNAANPFFSNIRQNMDLIGGVGEIPLKIPPYITSEVRRAMPKWIREILKEGGEKKVADKFLKLEKAEQRRMQDALSVNVTYDSPKTAKPRNTHTLAGLEKGPKNRYNNIWPYDHTRVKLTDYSPESCDYINASYVSTEFSSKRYIATQGPIPHTFKDFWSLVWDHDIRVIVMLTAEAEGGQLKCHKYWKEHSYGPYQLNTMSEKRIALDINKIHHRSEHRESSSRSRPSASTRGSYFEPESPKDSNAPHVIMRKFTLSHSSHPFSPLREITQLHYSQWPDFGAPADPAHILALIEQTELVVRSSASSRRSSASSGYGGDRRPSASNNNNRPVLVHCSAGCGRTGTFCATDSVIDMLKRQREYLMSNTPNPYRDGYVDRDGDSPMYSTFDQYDEDNEWIGDDRLDLVEKAVTDLRDQRLSMVQSLRQYVLCYETVAEWLARRGLNDGGNPMSWMKP